MKHIIAIALIAFSTSSAAIGFQGEYSGLSSDTIIESRGVDTSLITTY